MTYPTDAQIVAALEKLPRGVTTAQARAALIAAHEADRQEMLDYFALLKPEIEAMTAKGVPTKTLSQFRSEVIAKKVAQARAQAFREAIAACGRMSSATGSVGFGNGCAACADAISAIAAVPGQPPKPPAEAA